jgi:hypothetical protein
MPEAAKITENTAGHLRPTTVSLLARRRYGTENLVHSLDQD